MTETEALAAVAFWLPDVSRAAQKIRHRRGIADCRLPIADCRLPIADCRLPIADCRLPIADCRLPIADCRLPIADCRLPIADCRLPIADCRFYGNGVCGQVILVGLCHVFSFVLCQWLLPPTKAIIHKKTRMSSFFCKKICHSRFPRHSRVGGNQLAAGRRMLRRQSRRIPDGDFISPSFSRLRESTLLPFCYLRESANGDLSPKMANPCGGKAAGNFRRLWRR